MWDGDSRRVYAYIGARGDENLVLYGPFCYKPKTVLRSKMH